MAVYRDFAYTFDSDLNLKEMVATLNAAGPWQWIDRDSDRYGFYISAAALERPHKAMIKILVDEDVDRFAVNASIEADDKTTVENVERTLLDKVLPAIGARDLKATDTYE